MLCHSLIVLIFLLKDAFISVICRLIKVDFNPSALIILLNLNRLVFQPLQVLQLLDPFLEICFAAIV